MKPIANIVRDSIYQSTGAFQRNSTERHITDTIGEFVWDYVWNPVGESVKEPLMDSIDDFLSKIKNETYYSKAIYLEFPICFCKE